MSDPVVEAAQRAWEDYPVPADDVEPYLREVPLAVAREALKPIRELVQDISSEIESGTWDAADVLRELKPLIYSTEELAR